MKGALSIKDLVNMFSVPQTLTEIQNIETRADQAGYIYRNIAPVRNVASIRIDVIKGAAQLPVVASFTDYSSAAPRKGRKAVQVGEGRIPATKIAYDITAEDMERLLTPGSQRAQTQALEMIYQDRANAISAIIAREEYSLLQAFQTGTVNLSEPSVGTKRGISASFDYKVPSNRIKTLAQLWSDSSSPALAQIVDEANEFLSQNGFRPRVMLMSPTAVSLLCKNLEIRKAIHGDQNTSKLVTRNLINQLLSGANLPVIIEYDRRAEIGDTANGAVLAANKVVMLDGTVGSGANGEIVGTIARYGTTDRGPTIEAIADFVGDDYPWPESALSGIFARTRVLGSGDGAPSGSTVASATTIPNLPAIDRIRILTVAG